MGSVALCWVPIGVEPAVALRGSQELAAVLAAVAVCGATEVSGSCSRFVSVNSSLDGVISIGSVFSTSGGVATSPTGRERDSTGPGSFATGSTGSSTFSDSSDLLHH